MAKTIYNKIKSGKIPVIKKELEEGVIAEANRDGSIYVDKDIKKNSPLEKEAIAHEKVHLDQMQRGDLDYDDNSVYWKGKKYSRQKMNEGSKQLPWEKEAYNKTKHMKKSKNSAVKMSDADLVANNTQTHKKFQNLGSIAFDAAEEGFKGTQERFKNMPLPSKPEPDPNDPPTKMRSMPITKKAKSSPFKVNDGTEASKKVVTRKAKDVDGNLGTQTITVGSTAPIVSYRNKTLPSYAEAYKNVDKSKYPTLESFKDAAELYKEQKPEEFKKQSQEKVVTPGKTDVSDTFEKDVEKDPGKLNPGYYQSIDGKYAEAVRRRDSKGDMRRNAANEKKYDKLTSRVENDKQKQKEKFEKKNPGQTFDFEKHGKKKNYYYKLSDGEGGTMSKENYMKGRAGHQYDSNVLINKRSNPTESFVEAGEDVGTREGNLAAVKAENTPKTDLTSDNTQVASNKMSNKNKNKGPFKMKGFSGLQN
ncbi:MAG: hypothetical protein CMI74_02070 [Candidatus Pelagibacter sp.]|nr:hypothetical protein [Candidatus Pelagibacter sp.]